MGFLRKIAAKALLPEMRIQADPSLTEDPCLGDAATRAWADRVDAGDDKAFRGYLAGETDTERRDFTIDTVLHVTDPRAEWVDRWVGDEPESALAHMVRGRHMVLWAWEARSSARANDVKEEQFEQFFARLDSAWRSFERAIEVDPEEASTYALMISCAMGLQSGTDQAVELYNAAQSRRPWQQLAHMSMIQSLAAKWGGSNEEMFDFARYASNDAPEGSGVHVVIPDAHVEAWLEDIDQYWRETEVRDEIIAAAEKSIDSPKLIQTPWLPRIRNSFAFCFWKMGEKERARRQFELVGPLVGGPFRYSTVPLQQATLARRDVGAG